MALFRRKPKVPEWASFMAPDEYAHFDRLVRETLDAQGLEYRIDDGIVVTPDARYGLLNVAQMCHGEDDVRAVVEAHFASTLRGLPEMPDDWEDAVPLLRARFVSQDSVTAGQSPMVHRPLADLALVVACDFPETIGFVTEERAEVWESTADELLEIALRQTREREEAPEVEPIRFDDGTEMRALFGDSFFTTAHALWVEDGLLALPHRHAVLHHPIRDLSVVQAVGYMASMARGMFEEGPGSISDQLYWKRGDDLVHLPVGREGDAVQFFPPDEFVELMNGLAEPG